MSVRLNNPKVLAVDDEELNLDIMQEYFEAANIEFKLAHDGLEALEVLNKNHEIDVIVLDRMMPNMNGMEFLQKMKEDPKLRDIPVIMQTAATASHQIAEGIAQGVFYYLPKPYSKDVLLSLIHAANDDSKRRGAMRSRIKEYGEAMRMVERGMFYFKSVDEARILSVLIGSCLPDPENKIVALSELMINAVEHGNLKITYEEKAQLKKSETWEQEIAHRLALPENMNKFCELEILRDHSKHEFTIRIKDQGDGFDWQKFATFDPQRFMDPNGRGIMLTMNCGFDEISYQGNGSEVLCRVSLNNQKQ